MNHLSSVLVRESRFLHLRALPASARTANRSRRLSTVRRIPFFSFFSRTAYNRKLPQGPRYFPVQDNRDNNSSSTMAHNGPIIDLTEKEEKIRQILLDVAAEIDAEERDKSAEPLVLRITGGWVRDKLLKGRSHDIDIGINRMTGFDFASKLNEVLVRKKEKYGIDARSVHKIESNPDKSKHLETATTKVIDLDIDFVNLRSESYSAESRIPQMKFGTPKEDALRRDATVNALFYNLHTKMVEDFTESGLEDMEKKLIRTPLAPFETFSDDPLRVLRLIRFASRLEFDIVEDAQEAMRNEKIKEALKLKISRERIGVEVEKMLQGANPFGSLSLFHSLGLFDAVFSPPELQVEPGKPRDHLYIAAHVLRYLQGPQIKDKLTRIAGLIRDKSEEHIAWVICSLTPWAGQTVLEKKKPMPTAAVAARDGLKMKNKDVTIIKQCFSNYEEVQSIAVENISSPLSRLKLGLAIRKWGTDWRLEVLCGLLLDLIPHWKLNSTEQPDPEVGNTLRRYGELLNCINRSGLDDAWNLKPLLNGNELSKSLQKKPGTWTKGALDCVIEWQLEHPDGTKEEALEYILSKKEEL